MSLPRLSLSTQDSIEIARVLRGALRLRTVIVPLVAAPEKQGLHLLDIEVPGFGLVTLLAEPTGGARADGVPLSVRPATRAQMAELFALVERLDEPSPTVPPPSDPPEPFAEEITEIDLDGGEDDTVIDTGPAPASAASPSSASARRHSSISSLRAMRVVPAPSAESYIGRVLAGKYRIDAPIGKGAAATVYRATHKELRREVAIKILHAANQREPQFVRRFKAEALTASKLEHANVTRIIDFGQERDGELYLVMELVNGRPLDALLSTGGALGARRVVDIGIQVCRALAIAHDKGVIHRDIKPENIMIVADHDDDGEPCDLVKVCDFGLAKLREPDDESQEITAVGTVCGSPAYMSPEQIRAEPLDLHTDIYSLGVTLFEALTGALPHDGSSMNELFFKRCTQEPPTPSSLVPTVDALLDDVIVRAMAIDPRARQSSAHELRTELRTIRGHLVDEGAQEDHQTIIGG